MEYPKALYLQGECRIVADFYEEAEAQFDGFTDWTTDHERGGAAAQAAAQAAEEAQAAAQAAEEAQAAAMKRAASRKPKAE